MSVLEEAAALVGGPRQADYGPPKDNFNTIAGLWSTYLNASTGFRHEVSASDVAMLMILLKVARYIQKHDRDSLVDIVGYARCAELVAE